MPVKDHAGLFGADYIGHTQQTRVRVIVHSHIVGEMPANDDVITEPGVINCSKDVVSLSTSKSIKSPGMAAFTLVGRFNYINFIFPNDWINIWVDTGDGRGWIRLFFGFVDRIERSISVDGKGASKTMFNITCSDFSKAFVATNVYFNPHIADRTDFVGNFAGTKNLAGAQLRLKGVTAFGSPADVVLNFAHLLLGFGAQFIAPPKYPFNKALIEESRKFRKAWAKGRLPKEIEQAIGRDTIKKWFTSLVKEANAWEEILNDPETSADHKMNVAQSMGRDPSGYFAESFFTGGTFDKNDIMNWIIGQRLKDKGIKADSTEWARDPRIESAMAIEETALGDGHLLDLIDFSFVEYGAIDGSIVSAPIWQQQGPLWNIMAAYSNHIVNELFMDLRPLSMNNKDHPLSEGGYKQGENDEIHAQHRSDLGDCGVRFVPALIMREYPFSTVKSVNAKAAQVLGSVVGTVVFGGIFSRDPNIPGRKIEKIETLNDYWWGKEKESRKHLDVAVISVEDIISEMVGRSDAEVVNLIEVYSDGFMGKHMKFTTQDVQPIAIPVSVARHGLRVRTYKTRFARFPKSAASRKAGVDNASTRRKLVRWAMLLDHWYQHNIEYLSGNITTRAYPEIRVGSRLDIYERNESYYVESVSHEWSYPEGMKTTFGVSRGQRNDPYPLYEKPALPAFSGHRKTESRLEQMFLQMDPSSVTRAAKADRGNTDIGLGAGLDNTLIENLKRYKPYSCLAAQAEERDEDIEAAIIEKAQGLGERLAELADKGGFPAEELENLLPHRTTLSPGVKK